MAGEDKKQPIVVKKIVAGGHGHHGGSWKVAYADFVTAMMAFFLLLWLLGITDEMQREGISDYFKNPAGVKGPGGASTSLIKLGGAKEMPKGDRTRKQNIERTAEPTHKKVDGSTDDDKTSTEQGKQDSDDKQFDKISEQERIEDKRRLDELLHLLKVAIEKSKNLKQFKDQLFLDVTPDGLRIQIVDKQNRPMFDLGSAELKPYTVKILQEIGKVISKVPNRVSISGHTDATRFHRGYLIYENDYGEEIKLPYSNWELSADRANTARRVLLKSGLSTPQIGRVVGLSSSVPFINENPNHPMNRRISIIVMNRDAELAMKSSEGPVDGVQQDVLDR